MRSLFVFFIRIACEGGECAVRIEGFSWKRIPSILRGKVERKEGMGDKHARVALAGAANQGSREHRPRRKKPQTKLCSMAVRVAALREDTPSLL